MLKEIGEHSASSVVCTLRSSACLCQVLASRVRIVLPWRAEGPMPRCPCLQEPGPLVSGRAEGAVPAATAPPRLPGSFLSSSTTSDGAANTTVIPECCIGAGGAEFKTSSRSEGERKSARRC